MNSVQEIQTKINSSIQKKLRKCQNKDKALIKELEDEINQLQKTNSELDKLSQSDDHLHLLQVTEHPQEPPTYT